MPGLSESQLAVIRTLIDSVPDSAIRSLDVALAAERGDTPMGAIRDLVSAEAGERRARNLVLGPVMKLCPRGETPFSHLTFPSRTPSLLWRALKEADPGRFNAATLACMRYDDDGGPPEVFAELTALAAQGLRDAAGGPFATAAAALNQARPGGAEEFAAYLDLAPIGRNALPKLAEWVGHMTDERAAQVRLAFKDANAFGADTSPRLLEMMLCHLEDPWQILRLVSAIADRPSDTFLAASELAHIGERLMDDTDRRLDDLSAFDPQGGPAAGAAAAEAVRAVVSATSEFELSLDLKREGPWGRRIAKQKQALSGRVEALLNRADAAVGSALPLKTVKLGKMTRGAPSYRNPPDAKAVTIAEGLLSFLDHVRASASTGGFSSLRAKAAEKLDERLDRYVEDVLDDLRAEDIEHADTARQFLDIAATLVGLYRDEKAAQIVRRRAAA